MMISPTSISHVHYFQFHIFAELRASRSLWNWLSFRENSTHWCSLFFSIFLWRAKLFSGFSKFINWVLVIANFSSYLSFLSLLSLFLFEILFLLFGKALILLSRTKHSISLSCGLTVAFRLNWKSTLSNYFGTLIFATQSTFSSPGTKRVLLDCLGEILHEVLVLVSDLVGMINKSIL